MLILLCSMRILIGRTLNRWTCVRLLTMWARCRMITVRRRLTNVFRLILIGRWRRAGSLLILTCDLVCTLMSIVTILLLVRRRRLVCRSGRRWIPLFTACPLVIGVMVSLLLALIVLGSNRNGLRTLTWLALSVTCLVRC